MTTNSDPNEGGKPGSLPAERAELVHETRKTIKRMRALARLLRYELGEPEFERVDGLLRSAGQRLAGTRDADVRVATLERLKDRHPKALASEGVDRLCERLQRERRQTGEPAAARHALADIADMRRLLSSWNLVESDFETIGPGLRRIYREGRRRYARAEHEHGDDPEHVHDWRKRVKALYYALDMIGGLHAEGARRATRRADRLGDLLGEDHDLWMLHGYVEQHPDAFGEDNVARQKLLRHIERRRRRLRKRAFKLGTKLYRPKPGTFTRRITRALSR